MRTLILFFVLVCVIPNANSQTNICYAYGIKSFKVVDDGIQIVLDGTNGNKYGMLNPNDIAAEIKKRYERSGGQKKISSKLLALQILGHAGGYVVGSKIRWSWLYNKSRVMNIEWDDITW